VALAASLVVATAALVAFAVAAAAAFGGVLVVGIGLAAVAAARFKQQAQTAGTAAYELRRAAGRTFDTLIRQWGPAVDLVFRGLTSALRTVRPLITALAGPMALLGRAVQRGIGQFAQVLASPAVTSSLQQMVVAISDLVPPAAQIAAILLPFFIQLANFALPIITRLLWAAAGALQRWLGNGRGMQMFTQLLAYAVPHLKAWWALIKAVGGVLLGLIRVAAPFGLMLVQWLTKIVQKWSAWLNSSAGQARMREFFATVLPLAKSFLTFVGRLVLFFLQLAAAAAPALNSVFSGLNWVLGAAIKVFNWLRKPIAIIFKWVFPLSQFIGLLRLLLTPLIWVVKKAIEVGRKVWNWLKPVRAVKGAFSAVVGFVQKIINKIDGAIGKARDLANTLNPFKGGGVKDAAKHAWQQAHPGAKLPPQLRAAGGPVIGGRDYIVGEAGPELFRPSSSGHVVPNHDAFGDGGAVAVTLLMPNGDVLARETVRAARRRKATR
jgi:hypothetical protein